MSFFRFVYNQKDKSIGYAFLYTMVLGLIFSLSILFIILRVYFSLDSKKFVDEYNQRYGCQIVNYELSCNEDFYRHDNLIIDLRENLDYDIITYMDNDTIYLTKDKVYIQSELYTYREVFEIIGYQDNDLTIKDVKELIAPLVFGFAVIGLFFVFIGATLWYAIANVILAYIMGFLLRTYQKIYLTYDQLYKITIFVVTPYVLFNALTRAIFYDTFTGFITSFIPIIGGLIKLIMDYAIIYGLTYLAVAKSQQTIKQEIIE